jgi:hypothetical protein
VTSPGGLPFLLLTLVWYGKDPLHFELDSPALQLRVIPVCLGLPLFLLSGLGSCPESDHSLFVLKQIG